MNMKINNKNISGIVFDLSVNNDERMKRKRICGEFFSLME